MVEPTAKRTSGRNQRVARTKETETISRLCICADLYRSFFYAAFVEDVFYLIGLDRPNPFVSTRSRAGTVWFNKQVC